jgi:hypothetical protein
VQTKHLSDVSNVLSHQLHALVVVFHEDGLFYALVDDQLIPNEIIVDLLEVSHALSASWFLTRRARIQVRRSGEGSCCAVLMGWELPMKILALLKSSDQA